MTGKVEIVQDVHCSMYDYIELPTQAVQQAQKNPVGTLPGPEQLGRLGFKRDTRCVESRLFQDLQQGKLSEWRDMGEIDSHAEMTNQAS